MLLQQSIALLATLPHQHTNDDGPSKIVTPFSSNPLFDLQDATLDPSRISTMATPFQAMLPVLLIRQKTMLLYPHPTTMKFYKLQPRPRLLPSCRTLLFIPFHLLKNLVATLKPRTSLNVPTQPFLTSSTNPLVKK